MKKKLCSILVIAALVFALAGCGSNTANDAAGSAESNAAETTVTQKTTYTHAFSVSDTEQVYFAPGNLQYNPAKAEWRFAEESYDTVGTDNEKAAADYDGWIDLFAWGANGISGVEPYCTTVDNLMYGDGHNSIAGTKWDFAEAVNEQTGENWRMFTHDEIHYMLMYRDNAEQLFGYGTIDDVRGLFILPDDWQCPEGIDFTPSVEAGFENQYDWYYTIGDKENYTYNIFTASDWEKIEEAGGIFLPTAGMKYDGECDHIGLSGHYWTSSNYGEEFANCLCLFEHDLFLEGNFDRSYNLAVRLVKDAE